MATEKVRYIDDSEVEVEVHPLGFRKAMQITREFVPIEGITRHPDGAMTYNGKIDIFGLQLKTIETVKGLDLDKLDPEEGSRLYQKYFEKSVSMALGKGGDPQ